MANSLIKNLFHFSESRGKESAGIALLLPAEHQILLAKSAHSASDFLKSPPAKTIQENITAICRERALFACMGHSRLVTNGAALLNANNQPVHKGRAVVIHNGIITNADDIWAQICHVRKREAAVDTEALAALVDMYLESGANAVKAVSDSYKEIKGAASISLMTSCEQSLILATNTGSLYVYSMPEQRGLIFASENFILTQTLKKSGFDSEHIGRNISQVKPFSGIHISLSAPEFSTFQLFQSSDAIKNNTTKTANSVRDISTAEQPSSKPPTKHRIRSHTEENLLEFNIDEILKIDRCSRCVLPVTFPFISFDSQGVCNYCRNYKTKLPAKSGRLEELRKEIERHKSSSKVGDCVVAFSGGRDSSYGLHFLCKEMGLKPITYTYDWGMVTDLARRNIARITGKLGVENILVSADLRKKRDYIRMNVAAWLKRPNLGIVPLFMAGDKHFIKYGNIVKRQTGIQLDIWLPNQLESTDFKYGFCGIPPFFEKEKVDQLTFAAKLQMPLFYLKSFIANPAYINISMKDTAEAYWSYYVEKRDPFVRLYDYVRWDEKEVDKTIINEYEWEIAPDTESTWRIGDGTAPFYNYIYFTVAGFSENETFRSNQIREGDISRSEALRLIARDNRPRFQSLKWYFETIDLEFDVAIKTINSIPKLYRSPSATQLAKLSPGISM